MQLEIISTGDEVLTGFITDTNAPWLSQQVLELGIYVRRRHTVSDRLDDLTAILAERAQDADVLLVSGGLGPTSDDNTTLAAARAGGVELELHEEWLAQLQRWHRERDRPMSPANVKQALLPAGAVMLPNPCGTACGFRMRLARATCFFTPGVPRELRAMYQASIRPWLEQHAGGGACRVRRLFVFGIPESSLGERLAVLRLDPALTLGYRAAYPLLEVKLIGQDAPRAAEDAALAQVRDICAPYLLCEDEADLPVRIAACLGGRGACLADSVTGGVLGVALGAALDLSPCLVTSVPPDVARFEREHGGGGRLVLAVYAPQAEDDVHFYLHDPQGGCRRHVSYRLRPTLPERRREAMALLAQSFIYNALTGRPLLRPESSDMREEEAEPA